MLPDLEKVYVINVKSFVTRRRHVMDQLARFDIEPEFVHDWDVPDLNSESARWFVQPSTLSPAQQSCCMKHISALQRIVARRQDRALILEDDVFLSAAFPDAIRHVALERQRFSPLHVVFLGNGGNFYTPRSQRLPGQHLYRASKGRFGDSYMIDARTAQARLNWIAQHGISMPIDNQFDVMDRELGIDLLWFEDPVVEQGSKNGTFQSQIEPDPPPFIKGLLFGWEKLRRKYLYQIWR